MKYRIIPARAGFTILHDHEFGAVGDHPRSRGVYETSVLDEAPLEGSSPLARGLRGAAAARGSSDGIIPARAGFTIASDDAPESVTDHPRSRGVYMTTNCYGAPLTGSSPLARGLRAISAGKTCIPRIIPARAGFTRS